MFQVIRALVCGANRCNFSIDKLLKKTISQSAGCHLNRLSVQLRLIEGIGAGNMHRHIPFFSQISHECFIAITFIAAQTKVYMGNLKAVSGTVK